MKKANLTISDDHKGLLKAQQELFPHIPHQLCICHFMRNVLSYVPYIDEEWQTGRRYMKITGEDQDSEEDDPLLREIEQIKEGVKTQEELVTT